MPNYYNTSTGDRLTQRQINTRLTSSYKGMMEKYICEGCGSSRAVDHDHTISQKRCKELHKTELIWDEQNIAFSCRTCHLDWEAYKSGKFSFHANCEKRMLYLRDHDPEGFRKRLLYLERPDIVERINLLEI